MPEWFLENGNELIIAVMTVIASGFVALHFTPNAFKQRRVHRSKKAKLEAKLDQLQADLEKPANLLVEVMLVIVLFIVVGLFAYPAAFILVLVDHYVVNLVPESLTSPRPLAALIWNVLNCLLLSTFFLPILKRLLFLQFPAFRIAQLKRRLGRLKDDESLLP